MKKSNKTKRLKAMVVLSACCAMLAASAFKSRRDNPVVPYPEGFREWFRVKSVVIEKGSPAYEHWGGIHHIYANAKAREGYKTGSFADGSVLVFDVIAVIHRDSLIMEDKRRLIDVMVRDKNRYSSTGGWGYEEFNGDSKTERNVQALAAAQCYSCHVNMKTHDNVFSTITE